MAKIFSSSSDTYTAVSVGSRLGEVQFFFADVLRACNVYIIDLVLYPCIINVNPIPPANVTIGHTK